MRIYPATIRSYCFLHSLRSFAKTNSVKNGKKNPVSNAQTTHVAWATAPKAYCQQRSRGAFFCACAKKNEKWMTSIPIFLTLWILVVLAGPSDEDILMIKVRTKREKSPKTWSLRFELLKIKMCKWDRKPLRLALRCWCFTCKNHKVVFEDGSWDIWSDERS